MGGLCLFVTSMIYLVVSFYQHNQSFNQRALFGYNLNKIIARNTSIDVFLWDSFGYPWGTKGVSGIPVSLQGNKSFEFVLLGYPLGSLGLKDVPVMDILDCKGKSH